jgi:hypothetical protein
MDNFLEDYSRDEFNLLVTNAVLESLHLSDKINRNLVTLWFQVEDKKKQRSNVEKLERLCQFAHGIFEVDATLLQENVIKKIRHNSRDLETIRRLKKYIEEMNLDR